jgi:hypothetical protein
MSQELKDRALEAAAKRALYVEPHLEVWLSEDDFQHIFQQAFEAYDKVMATAPAPAEHMPGSGFYLNSGRKVVMDEGFLTHVATLLEHNSFGEDSSDAFTATEYANEIYRILFAQRGSPSPQPTEADHA